MIAYVIGAVVAIAIVLYITRDGKKWDASKYALDDEPKVRKEDTSQPHVCEIEVQQQRGVLGEPCGPPGVVLRVFGDVIQGGRFGRCFTDRALREVLRNVFGC